MNFLNLRPVAHTIHNMNNDYDFHIPHVFQVSGLLGVAAVAVGGVSLVAAPSAYGAAGVAAGVALMLPAGVTRVVTHFLLGRRFRVRDGIAQHAELRGDEQVLDIGVGSGITLFALARQLTSGKGVGIDIYDPNAGGGTPQIFWKNAKKEGVTDKVDLKNMDARNMTFADQSFDVVVSTFAFHHFGGSDARRKAALEIVRVLKPGGKVLVYDGSFALNELEQVLRDAGFHYHRHGDKFSMVMGKKS